MAARTRKLAAHGVSAELPDGWEGHITVRASVGGDAPFPVTHLATFPLPTQRGDFGGGAVEQMRAGDVFITLFEYGPESATRALFAKVGVPSFVAADFDPNQLQRALAGQAGAQRFFHVGERAFCLYVVLGSTARVAQLARSAEEVVSTIQIGART